jgi:hypothetical protein
MIRRRKNIRLKNITKLRWDEKQKSKSPEWNNYILHYLIHFDVAISSLPRMITEEKIEEQINPDSKKNGDKKDSWVLYGDKKDSWVLNLGTYHKIWTWKAKGENSKDILIKILESINKKVNNQYVSPIKLGRKEDKINFNNHPLLYPVIYHPSADLRGLRPDLRATRNYIQEIHLKRSNITDKIQVTIVYNNERLREHARLDYVYKIIRKLRHGRTFDVETFSINLDKNGYPIEFDFPDIYSGHDNTLEKDDIHGDACNLKIKYCFDENISRPITFINTSNHAMGEIDNNCNKWKIEYRLWDEKCPIYLGTNSRCEVEKYLSKYGIEAFFRKCIDSKFFFCNESKKISPKDEL